MRESESDEAPRSCINHVAAMSWAETTVPDNRLASHKWQKTGFRSANQVEVDFIFIASGTKIAVRAVAALSIWRKPSCSHVTNRNHAPDGPAHVLELAGGRLAEKHVDYEFFPSLIGGPRPLMSSTASQIIGGRVAPTSYLDTSTTPIIFGLALKIRCFSGFAFAPTDSPPCRNRAIVTYWGLNGARPAIGPA